MGDFLLFWILRRVLLQCQVAKFDALSYTTNILTFYFIPFSAFLQYFK